VQVDGCFFVELSFIGRDFDGRVMAYQSGTSHSAFWSESSLYFSNSHFIRDSSMKQFLFCILLCHTINKI